MDDKDTIRQEASAVDGGLGGSGKATTEPADAFGSTGVDVRHMRRMVSWAARLARSLETPLRPTERGRALG